MKVFRGISHLSSKQPEKCSRRLTPISALTRRRCAPAPFQATPNAVKARQETGCFGSGPIIKGGADVGAFKWRGCHGNLGRGMQEAKVCMAPHGSEIQHKQASLWGVFGSLNCKNAIFPNRLYKFETDFGPLLHLGEIRWQGTGVAKPKWVGIVRSALNM